MQAPVHQGHLVETLKSLLKEHTIVNVNTKLNVKYPATGSSMEFDVYLPNLNLCFEFQDAYHYTTMWYNQTSQASVLLKDDIKKELARQHGLSLIDVPCWWDTNPESLSASLQFFRPDITLPYDSLSSSSSSLSFPISLNPPLGFFQKNSIPEVGELMLASFPADLEKFNSEMNTNKWWMGEKYDGIRCCWNSNDNVVTIDIPEKFHQIMPTIFLDGEFWFGRGEFYYTYSLIKNSTDIHWHFIRIVLFDIPGRDWQMKPFEERYSLLVHNLDIFHPFATLAFRVECFNSRILNFFAASVIDNSGEGVILRKHNSIYENGRSLNLVKLKMAQCDQEGIVVGVNEDHSVLLKLANGKTITIAASNVLIKTTIEKGEIVTFSFERHARRDTPVNAQLLRLRSDLHWEDVLKSYQFEAKQKGFTSKPMESGNKKIREFFEKVATSKRLDPGLADTWYNVQEKSIRKHKRGRLILQKFKGSYFDALKHVFPELPLLRDKFNKSQDDSTKKHRKYLEEFAKHHGLDPHTPETWYFLSRKQLTETRKGGSILLSYGGSYFQTLQHLFPEIGLDKWSYTQHSNWSDIANRRKFFEMYAKKHGFDPFVAVNWYTVSRDDILTAKGGRGVLFHYRSFPRALLSLFPAIGLDKTKFQYKTIWQSEKNRVSFFEAIAKDNQFDHRVASNWYSLAVQEIILRAKGSRRVLWYHDNSVAKALSDLFPNIGLDASKFERSVWHSNEKRKVFFDSFALQKGFDPRDSNGWHTCCADIMNTDGILAVLSYHNFNLSKALLDIYPNIGLRQSLLKHSTNIWSDPANRRKFFENYAYDNRFDPQNANNWYSHRDSVLNTKGIKGVLVHYSNSLAKALVSCFPNIGLEVGKLEEASVYNNVLVRRKFFEDFARRNNVDPFQSDTWYSQSRTALMSEPGAQKVLSYHNYSVPQALVELFPNIGLKISRFQQTTWDSTDNRRNFFERYAKENGFDPLFADNWYSQSKDQILTMKGAKGVLQYHENSLSQALLDLFPEINLVKSKFQNSLWGNDTKRRKFFEEYAADNGFDPLIPDNWYSQPRDSILDKKGGRRVIFYHQHSISQALVDLFPEIGLSKQMFERAKWRDPANRRQFFEEYAKFNLFDPLNALMWYQQPLEHIMGTKGASRVIFYHVNNVSKALVELFPEVKFEKHFQLTSLWRDVGNRRNVFEKYAKENNFDPYVPDNWYSQPQEKIKSYKGVVGILCYYQNKISKALEHLFPGISSSKFKH